VTFPLEAEVKVRARHDGERARIEALEGGAFALRFASPVRAISPGQVAVAYAGDRVLGGGVIVAAGASAGEEAA
jgi:tRNA-specific 2-thiouridylase